ncbi:MBL fold metallo-hydrolase [Ruminococcus sp.]|uniref:MBL fold metallo-hydrolase n=1 Tax=Ruminococcus sp. TaxID=41978 RepID=UPI0025FAB77D|nr:MBL fold metallo-hydrolase [Ruminococcus sp.]MBQ8965598.1 MBL fold metallo-hydrolase [Ruminococcus sp.]
MARMYPLFSSSSGNCTYIGDESSGILIDAGVSCKRICTALNDRGIETSAVKAIFITHTHSDHIAGLKVLTKKLEVPVYSLRGNLEILAREDKVSPVSDLYEMNGSPVQAAGYEITAFDTPHDTPVSCGFRVTAPSGADCAVCTDLGHVTEDIHNELTKCRLVLLESNYDPKMLRTGPYPPDLKQRIASEHGHLSNHDCGAELVKLVKAGVYSFVLGHISQHNNTVQLAESSAVRALCEFERGEDYLLTAAKPEGIGRAVIF